LRRGDDVGEAIKGNAKLGLSVLTPRLNDDFIAVSDGYLAQCVPLRTALSGLIQPNMVGRTVGLNRRFTCKAINAASL
jgi:hypothetical protein